MAEEEILMCSIALHTAIGRKLALYVGEEIFFLQLGFMNAFVKSPDFF